MYLYINTCINNNITVGLLDKKGAFSKKLTKKIKYDQSDSLLGLIDSLKFKDFSGVVVVVGPGPFTSVRIGVVVANAISWAKNIPILGVRSGGEIDIAKLKRFKLQLPFYSKEPNITKPNKK